MADPIVVPPYSPFNPLHYLHVVRFILTGKLRKLDLTKRWQHEERLNRILPIAIAIITWLTILIFSVSIDIYLFNNPPQRIPEVVQNDQDTTSTADTEIENNVNPNSTVTTSLPVSPLVMCISGTIAWLVAVVVSIIGANWYKGAANIAISLLVSAMLQAKVLKWIDDPMIQVAFVVIRITECATLLTLGSNVVTHFGGYLKFLSPAFSTLVTLGFAALMTLPRAITGTIVGVLIIPYAAIVAHLYTSRISSAKTAKQLQMSKFEVYGFALAPFCLSILGDWVYHAAFMFNHPVGMSSIENILSVLAMALLMAVLLFAAASPQVRAIDLNSGRFKGLLSSGILLALINSYFVSFYLLASAAKDGSGFVHN